MPRETYVYRPEHPEANKNGFVEKWKAWEAKTDAHYIISDGMGDLWHPANGKYYDSKSTFRKVTKAYGCEEIGNETQTDNRSKNSVSKSDVARAMEMVRQGYRPNVLSEQLD